MGVSGRKWELAQGNGVSRRKWELAEEMGVSQRKWELVGDRENYANYTLSWCLTGCYCFLPLPNIMKL